MSRLIVLEAFTCKSSNRYLLFYSFGVFDLLLLLLSEGNNVSL